jgi:hypothetical protein
VQAAVLAATVIAAFPCAADADSRGTITQLAVNGSAAAGQPFSFTIDATLADPSSGSYVFVGVETASAGCPSQEADAIYSNGEDPSTNPFPITAAGPAALAPGAYVLCAWLANPGNAADVFDFKSAAFTVGPGGTIALSFSPTPADNVWLKVVAAGTSDVAGQLSGSYKRAGPTATCTPTPDADTGQFVSFPYGGTDGSGSIAAGQYRVFDDGLQIPAGSWLMCDWLLDAGGDVVARGSQQLTVGPFHGTISLPPPFTVTSPEQATVPVAFHLNAPRRLWMTLSTTVVKCAPAFSEQNGIDPFAYPGFDQIGRRDHVVEGTTNVMTAGLLPDGTENVDIRGLITDLFGALVPGRYHVCAWLANDDKGAQTDAGPVSTTVTVPAAAGSGAGPPPIPSITGYDWKFNAAHVLRLKIWLSGKAKILVTLTRSPSGRGRRLATLAFDGHPGVNRFVIRSWHGIRLGPGRYAISLRTQIGHRRSPPRTFAFTL